MLKSLSAQLVLSFTLLVVGSFGQRWDTAPGEARRLQASPPTSATPTPAPTSVPTSIPTSFGVERFVLVNAINDMDVVAFDKSGDVVVPPSALDLTTESNIRADVRGNVGSVQLELTGADGSRQVRTEDDAPYALFGDNNGGDYIAGSLEYDVNYTLTATPYDENGGANGDGVPGDPLTVDIVFVSAPTSTPTT